MKLLNFTTFFSDAAFRRNGEKVGRYRKEKQGTKKRQSKKERKIREFKEEKRVKRKSGEVT